MGLVTPLDVFIGVKAYIGEQVCMIFDVHDHDRLIFTSTEINMFSFVFIKWG